MSFLAMSVPVTWSRDVLSRDVISRVFSRPIQTSNRLFLLIETIYAVCTKLNRNIIGSSVKLCSNFLKILVQAATEMSV